MLCGGFSVALLQSLTENVFHKINGMEMDDWHAVAWLLQDQFHLD